MLINETKVSFAECAVDEGTGRSPRKHYYYINDSDKKMTPLGCLDILLHKSVQAADPGVGLDQRLPKYWDQCVSEGVISIASVFSPLSTDHDRGCVCVSHDSDSVDVEYTLDVNVLFKKVLSKFLLK